MSAPSPLSLDWLNAAPAPDALAALDGLYEHSPWIAEAALAQRPFASLAQMKYVLVQVVRGAGRETGGSRRQGMRWRNSSRAVSRLQCLRRCFCRRLPAVSN